MSRNESWKCDDCDRGLHVLLPPDQFDDETTNETGIGVRRGERVAILCAKCFRKEGDTIAEVTRGQLVLEVELRNHPGVFVAFDSRQEVVATGETYTNAREAAIMRGAIAPLVLFSAPKEPELVPIPTPAPTQKQPRLHLRVDNRNPAHVSLTVFMNGGNCGQLTMRAEELTTLLTTLTHGWKEAGIKLEITG